MDDADSVVAALGMRPAVAHVQARPCGDGFAAGRRCAVRDAARLAPPIGPDRLFFVVFPDESAVRAELERHGDVETDGDERGKQQATQLHAVIVPAAAYSAASR